MAQSTVTKHLYDGSLTISDGTGVPLTYTTAYDQGDLSISGLAQSLRDVVPYQTRATLRSVRYAALNFPTFSFTAHMRDFTEDAAGSLLDVFRKTGTKWAAAVSTLGANAEVYTLKIQLTVEGSDYGDADDAVISLDDCFCTVDFAEGEPNLYTVNGTCYGAISVS